MPEPLCKIFIVDDDKFLLGMYELKFRTSGHDVTTAMSVPDALSKLKEGYVPDALLLDILLGAASGLDLLETIRREKLIPDTAVIMLTNQSSTEDIERAKSLNVAGYLVKATLVPSEVVEQVVRIISERKKAVT
jgi:CheY-like chemotaxis protein